MTPHHSGNEFSTVTSPLTPDAALPRPLGNEADWPQCSWSTGVNNQTACPASTLPANVTAQSLYARMVERNRCAHRDFQNIGVNGARMCVSRGLRKWVRCRLCESPHESGP